MLSFACRRFRRRFEAGAGSASHRRRCATCDAWASAVEAATEARRRPLPTALAERLRAVARTGEEPAGEPVPPVLAEPLSQLPMPPALAESLKAVARGRAASEPSLAQDLKAVAHSGKGAASGAEPPALAEPLPALPMPPKLAAELKAIAHGEEQTGAAEPVSPVLAGPLPALPMPPALAGRLRAIAEQRSRSPWVPSSYSAAAASLLLALALNTFAANAVAAVPPAAAALGERAASSWQAARRQQAASLEEWGAAGRERWLELSATTRSIYDAMSRQLARLLQRATEEAASPETDHNDR
jgi:hypothetical protein